jgi:hypothetical protein
MDSIDQKKVPAAEVWIFKGLRNPFPSAVFSTFEAANEWIKTNALSGTLTKYPVDISAYDWAIMTGRFKPKKESHTTAEFIANYSSGSQEHYHYDEGMSNQIESISSDAVNKSK